MAKGKPKGYFQFPLCLLTLDLPVKEWVQAVVSYVAIEKGRALRAKIPTYWLTNELLSEADESRLLADLSWEEQRLYNGRLLNGSSMIAEIIASQRLKGVLRKNKSPRKIGVVGTRYISSGIEWRQWRRRRQ